MGAGGYAEQRNRLWIILSAVLCTNDSGLDGRKTGVESTQKRVTPIGLELTLEDFACAA